MHFFFFFFFFSDSPELKKRTSFPYRGLEKSASSSDGESDSGCSTQADTRHELAPELEYSLDCPSGLSLLLELMTQSPQRYSSRDILDLNPYSESNSPGHKQVRDDPEKERTDSDVLENKKLAAHAGRTESAETASMHIHLCSDNEHNSKLTDAGRYIFEVSENRTGSVECTVYTEDGDFSTSTRKSHGHEINEISGILIPSQTTPVYEFQIYNGQETKIQHVQRRISFDDGNGRVRCSSPSDQPIDYSQLSSRRKESTTEQQSVRMHYAVTAQEINCNKEKTRRTSQDSHSVTETVTSGPVVGQKYEFILSPKMDSNGNIVLSQSQKFLSRSSLSSKGPECAANENDRSRLAYTFQSYEHNSGTANYVQQNSPLSGSPASPVHYSSDSKHETALEIAKAKFEPQKYGHEKTGVSKAQLTYHPKLKYLLATSQYANTKLKHDDGSDTSATASCSPSYSPYQQSVLFTQDQNAQTEKFPKLKDHNKNVYTRSEVGHNQRIPSSEIFPAFNNAPNRHNASVFIINPASTFKTCPSSISISKGSPVCNNQQQVNDIHPSQMISSPSVTFSNCFNGSPTSDQLQFEKVQDTPMALSPTSPDQPLSPASLRDQQSALSELLFSTNQKPGVDPYACADCGKRYSTSSNLARHRQTHRSVCDKKARKCPHCDKVYVSMPAYSMHVRTHNQGCECPHCGKKFSRPWLLQGHIRTHTGEKPFGCPQCGKSFADKSNLRAHIQTHSTEKPYVCGRCGKAFALKSYLYKHEESSCMRGQRFRH